jgi:hypothetical protein
MQPLPDFRFVTPKVTPMIKGHIKESTIGMKLS